VRVDVLSKLANIEKKGRYKSLLQQVLSSPSTKKLNIKVAKYTLISGKLFRGGYSMPLLRCVTPEKPNIS